MKVSSTGGSNINSINGHVANAPCIVQTDVASDILRHVDIVRERVNRPRDALRQPVEFGHHRVHKLLRTRCPTATVREWLRLAQRKSMQMRWNVQHFVLVDPPPPHVFGRNVRVVRRPVSSFRVRRCRHCGARLSLRVVPGTERS